MHSRATAGFGIGFLFHSHPDNGTFALCRIEKKLEPTTTAICIEHVRAVGGRSITDHFRIEYCCPNVRRNSTYYRATSGQTRIKHRSLCLSICLVSLRTAKRRRRHILLGHFKTLNSKHTFLPIGAARLLLLLLLLLVFFHVPFFFLLTFLFAPLFFLCVRNRCDFIFFFSVVRV